MNDGCLNGYVIEKYPAGYCVKNAKGEYLWFGSDDGEEPNYFFTDSPRRTIACEYSDTVTCYSKTVWGAKEDLQKFLQQELENDNSIKPSEVITL